jgi:phosphatidylglycerophosphate synthase
VSALPWRTWANLLTACRFCLAAPSAVAIVHAAWPLAALLFALAVATDLADGALARRLGQASPLGGLLDHATDACFVAITLAALAAAGLVPWPLPVLVPLAFLQYALDSRALAGRPLRASRLGRWNGIAYFVIAGGVLLDRLTGVDWAGADLWRALGWVLVASTLLSMLDRTLAWRRRTVPERSANPD